MSLRKYCGKVALVCCYDLFRQKDVIFKFR